MSTDDPLRNPKDPIHKSGPNAGLELFRRMSKAATDFPHDAVIDAACNLLINAIRQGNPDWRRAEAAFNEMFGRSKQLLKDHYDAAGRKKGVFPFDQVIMPSLHIDRDKTSH